MALSANLVWEVRTTGADTNGGGFDSSVASPGTDYSQQDSAQANGTDLAVDSVTNTKVTSASHSFVAADVGNVVNISAGTGWTTGFYTINSVSGGAATLDRSPAAVSTTGGTWAMGGALATPAKALGALVSGSKVYIKSGTYTQTTTTTLPTPQVNSAGQNPPARLIGYGSTRDDGGTKPVIQTNTNSINLFTTNSANAGGFIWSNLSFKNGATTRAKAFTTGSSGNVAGWRFINCLFDGFTNAIFGDFNVVWSLDVSCFNCEFKNGSGSSNNYIQVNSGVFYGCYFHDNAGTAINFTNPSNSGFNMHLVLDHCIFYKNNKAIFAALTAVQERLVVRNCAFVSQTSDAIGYNDSSTNIILTEIYNSIFDSNGGWAVNNPGTPPSGGHPKVADFFADYNAFYNNTSGTYHNLSGGPHDVTLTGSPFTSPSGGDFTLNSTAGAGAACKGAGWPGTITVN